MYKTLVDLAGGVDMHAGHVRDLLLPRDQYQ